jgi:hypothetical protein
MELVNYLRARLKIERDELEQLLTGGLRIHRRTAAGEFVDETEQSIARVQHLIDGLQSQIKHCERQQFSPQEARASASQNSA